MDVLFTVESGRTNYGGEAYLKEITIEVWGDFACFSAPYAKVERLTYPFPTPSAARGILSAIYMKPKEFRWQINRIEVLNPIRYISFKRNEVKCTVGSGADLHRGGANAAADDGAAGRPLPDRGVDHSPPGFCGKRAPTV